MEPEYPYDLEELKQIERLLGKVPIYKKKMAELLVEIEAFSHKVAELKFSILDIPKIEQLILKAFYIDCENRPFNLRNSNTIGRLLAEIAWHGEIKNRNLPCEICGDNRSIDYCHIIPSRLGGIWEKNTLILCPTHHRLIDRFMLSKAEWAIIDWSRKSKPSQKYAYSVILKNHKAFWKKIEKGGEPEKLGEYPYKVNEKVLIRYAIDKIGDLLIQGRPVERSSLYKMLDPNIQGISKKVIKHLIKLGHLKQIKNGKHNLLILGSKKLEVSDKTILRIWQMVA